MKGKKSKWIHRRRQFSRAGHKQRKKPILTDRLKKNLAATYSRGTYRTTTIGNAVFHGRVRDGNGWDHSFMATKKCK